MRGASPCSTANLLPLGSQAKAMMVSVTEKRATPLWPLKETVPISYVSPKFLHSSKGPRRGTGTSSTLLNPVRCRGCQRPGQAGALPFPAACRSGAVWSLVPVRPRHLLPHTRQGAQQKLPAYKGFCVVLSRQGPGFLRSLPVPSSPFLLPSPTKHKTKTRHRPNTRQALPHLKTETQNSNSCHEFKEAAKRNVRGTSSSAAACGRHGMKPRPPHAVLPADGCNPRAPAPQEVNVGGGQLPLASEEAELGKNKIPEFKNMSCNSETHELELRDVALLSNPHPNFKGQAYNSTEGQRSYRTTAVRLAFHFHHVHRYLFFPHSENFKICDNALL